MKRALFIFTSLFLSANLLAQPQADLDKFNSQRNKITRNGMIALGGWSAVNLIYSGIATGQASGTTKYFHQMNVMWGGINLGLGVLGYFGARKSKMLSRAQSLKQQSGVEKTYLFNAGLDVAYITSGLYLREKSKTAAKNPQKLKGYGESIMLQGAALLLLDAVMFTVHNSHGKKLYSMIDKVQVGITGNGLSMVINL